MHTRAHSPLAILILLASAFALAFLMGCSQYRWKGSVGYSGQYGDYSIGSDGKNIVTDIRLKDPNGYAK